ncbi:N-acetyltransferase separation anxiety, putative [Entamoeba invadens IP1]|uniref:N-alpha-acetyltransferase 60 n=1 Tax=Entamoeba invadens IP1 TaxID=370355 RepID=A0A0A1TW77_ENTIV|nr:N-acetyltransferase separation anxiety, putative [Entamoeba invadens IP1]ELP83538.1 N-acetyltransferase separation anxiety, putative [Entamoeba invadens IP1]|eukprot:XP_004182884.1 N-acetyltransferase separation anxiety, putative [Entamoeba invadens IP1]
MTLGVENTHQKNGIGGRLLEFGCQKMEEQNCSSVYLHALTTNTSAHQFYKNHSFVIKKLIPKYYSFSETPQDAYYLQRNFKEVRWSFLTYCFDQIIIFFDST